MSFHKTYEAAKQNYKPMRRNALRSSGKPMKRTRMKAHRPSPEEKQWREEVLRRDGYQCRWVDQQTGMRCEVTGAANLDAHHIRERTQRPDLVLELSNGAALCGGPGRHHDRAHHTVQGRKDAIAQKLLGGETYEASRKRKRESV